jgi:hypothetical protein
MNAVEIEEAVSLLADAEFDPLKFPYAFLAAFGNKETALKRLRSGSNNNSDLAGAVLQRGNIHLAVCAAGAITATLDALRASPKTAALKVKFILATDGQLLGAEDLTSGEPLACELSALGDHFGFFLPLAGISTVKQIKNNPIDIRATSKLNKLYIELLKDNPDWDTPVRRHDMNHFMARLIFCFFAEDTGIFPSRLFTTTIDQMTDSQSNNTHEVLAELFRAMDLKFDMRRAAGVPSWADRFPYVNGALFSGATDCPRFSRIARSYLLAAARLDWQHINPDIFGSMIQAVAEAEERGALGMHYTSVPNILKVLNPLFLDDLRSQLEEAGDNPRMLLNLRKRMAKIRVFDPACGSGNFLVIAYKQMREIEAEINRRRGELHIRTDIPVTNFRGIELHDFPAEIARLALIIAEYQCDALYRGQQEALQEFLPLDKQNWITCGNALRLDWLSVCPPVGKSVMLRGDDLLHTPLDQAQVDFNNAGGETFICGNPPYLGSTWQSADQKEDLRRIFEGRITTWKSLDYVAGWFMKAAEYGLKTPTVSAFVSTNSICQGQQVSNLWPLIFDYNHEIIFAYTSFKWANLANQNAGVTVVIVAIARKSPSPKKLFSLSSSGQIFSAQVENINAYLVGGVNVIVQPTDNILSGISKMDNGNKPVDGGHLLLETDELQSFGLSASEEAQFVRRYVGSQEAINGKMRYCLWIPDSELEVAAAIPSIKNRIERVRHERLQSPKKSTRDAAGRSHAFQEIRQSGHEILIVVPRVSSENRDYLPCALMEPGAVMSDKVFALYDAPLWNLALIVSRLHWVWIGTVCVRMRTDFSYSNTLGWNTFPVPFLTEKNKVDLTRCAKNILLAREAHFPASIADLYNPVEMPDDLRRAHAENDEVIERIYIGRCFKNDTERLEKLFDLYIKMTGTQPVTKKARTKS